MLALEITPQGYSAEQKTADELKNKIKRYEINSQQAKQ